MKVWIIFIVATVILQVSAPESNTGFTMVFYNIIHELS